MCVGSHKTQETNNLGVGFPSPKTRGSGKPGRRVGETLLGQRWPFDSGLPGMVKRNRKLKKPIQCFPSPEMDQKKWEKRIY